MRKLLSVLACLLLVEVAFAAQLHTDDAAPVTPAPAVPTATTPSGTANPPVPHVDPAQPHPQPQPQPHPQPHPTQVKKNEENKPHGGKAEQKGHGKGHGNQGQKGHGKGRRGHNRRPHGKPQGHRWNHAWSMPTQRIFFILMNLASRREKMAQAPLIFK